MNDRQKEVAQVLKELGMSDALIQVITVPHSQNN